MRDSLGALDFGRFDGSMIDQDTSGSNLDCGVQVRFTDLVNMTTGRPRPRGRVTYKESIFVS